MTATRQPLAIIAGGGRLPAIVAAAAEASGRPALILGIEGEAGQDIAAFRHEWIKWGKFARTEQLIKQHGAEEIVFVGTIGSRPDFQNLGLDALTLKLLPRILSILIGGDDTVLSGAVKFIEGRGFRVIGAHTVATELVAEAGCLTKRRPDRDGVIDSALALKAARAIGLLDAGQATVALAGRIVALEGAEGTDTMLTRVGTLRDSRRISWRNRAGVLGKCAKPQQDLRVDMPAVGARTVEIVAELGLAGIAIEAERVMFVDRAAAIAAADKAGIFIVAERLDGPVV